MSSPDRAPQDVWFRLRRLQSLAEAAGLPEESVVRGLLHTVTQELTLFANEKPMARLAPAVTKAVASFRNGEIQEDVIEALPELDMIDPEELPVFIALLQLGLLERLLDDLASGVTAEGVRTVTKQLRSLADSRFERFWRGQDAYEVLLGDPSGAFRLCDHATRAAYFHALATIAARSSKRPVEVAATAVTMARDAPLDAPHSHVGYYLIGDGRRALEATVGCRSSLPRTADRVIRAHPTAVYLGTISVVTAALLLGAMSLLDGITTLGAAGTMAALLLIPAISLSVDIANCGVSIFRYPPPRLPKLAFPNGVSDEFRTAVALPVIIHNEHDIDSMVQTAETNYQANADRNIIFVFLTDFADAVMQHTTEDETLIEALQLRTRQLNRKYGDSGFTPFILIHRDRSWNAAANVWMGRERKLGKLEEFNRFLLGERAVDRVSSGDLSLLGSVRFIITLDADTLLPAGSAARLIGTLAHPLNTGGATTPGAGFTVLQPRMKGHTATTPFDIWFPITPALSARGGIFWSCRYDIQQVYHAFFGDCLYCGKGIYDLRRFQGNMCLPDNSVLSHDHIEGMHGRAGFVNDIVLLETPPPNLLTHMRAHHRWTRGDWQLLPWLLGVLGERDCSLRVLPIDRWRLFENLRWSLLPIAVLVTIAVSWLLLPSKALLLTIAMLFCYTSQTGLPPLAAIGRAAFGKTSRRRASLEVREGLARHGARALMAVAFLPFEVIVTMDAIVRALYRMLLNRRKLLEWSPMAQTGRAIGSRMTRRFAWREMSTATFAVLLLAVVVVRTSPAVWIAAPLLILWLVAPQLAYWTALPSRQVQ